MVFKEKNNANKKQLTLANQKQHLISISTKKQAHLNIEMSLKSIISTNNYQRVYLKSKGKLKKVRTDLYALHKYINDILYSIEQKLTKQNVSTKSDKQSVYLKVRQYIQLTQKQLTRFIQKILKKLQTIVKISTDFKQTQLDDEIRASYNQFCSYIYQNAQEQTQKAQKQSQNTQKTIKNTQKPIKNTQKQGHNANNFVIRNDNFQKFILSMKKFLVHRHNYTTLYQGLITITQAIVFQKDEQNSSLLKVSLNEKQYQNDKLQKVVLKQFIDAAYQKSFIKQKYCCSKIINKQTRIFNQKYKTSKTKSNVIIFQQSPWNIKPKLEKAIYGFLNSGGGYIYCAMKQKGLYYSPSMNQKLTFNKKQIFQKFIANIVTNTGKQNIKQNDKQTQKQAEADIQLKFLPILQVTSQQNTNRSSRQVPKYQQDYFIYRIRIKHRSKVQLKRLQQRPYHYNQESMQIQQLKDHGIKKDIIYKRIKHLYINSTKTWTKTNVNMRYQHNLKDHNGPCKQDVQYKLLQTNESTIQQKQVQVTQNKAYQTQQKQYKYLNLIVLEKKNLKTQLEEYFRLNHDDVKILTLSVKTLTKIVAKTYLIWHKKKFDDLNARINQFKRKPNFNKKLFFVSAEKSVCLQYILPYDKLTQINQMLKQQLPFPQIKLCYGYDNNKNFQKTYLKLKSDYQGKMGGIYLYFILNQLKETSKMKNIPKDFKMNDFDQYYKQEAYQSSRYQNQGRNEPQKQYNDKNSNQTYNSQYNNQGYSNQGYNNQGYNNQGYNNQGYNSQQYNDKRYNKQQNNAQASKNYQQTPPIYPINSKFMPQRTEYQKINDYQYQYIQMSSTEVQIQNYDIMNGYYYLNGNWLPLDKYIKHNFTSNNRIYTYNQQTQQYFEHIKLLQPLNQVY